MASFSIIVPFIGNDLDFENTLASVLRNNTDAGKVIVVHDGTYEDVYGLGDEVAFIATEPHAQLIRMFSAGLRQCTSEFVLLIRPGMELPFNWEAVAIEAFEDPRVASISPAIVGAERKTELVSAGVNIKFGMRRELSGKQIRLSRRNLKKIRTLGPTSWAAAYRRSALEQLGTPDETLDSVYLDLDLALGLKSLGYSTRFVSDLVFSTSRPTLITRDADAPHGCSAQRAATRYPKLSTSGLVSSMVCELVQSPLKPNLLQHLWQRPAAKQFSDIDAMHARRIRDRKAISKVEQVPVETPTWSRAA